MSTSIDARKTVAQLAREHPGLTRIFDKLGVDYCCGGKRSLREACSTKGLDVETVVQTLNAFAEVEWKNGLADGGADWPQAGLAELCDHIEKTHHKYLRIELPRLSALVDKVVGVHGGGHPSLYRVQHVFNELSRELLSHLQKEEEILFPLIRKLASDGPSAYTGSVAAPIHRMESEHDGAGNALETIRQLTDDYTPPSDACGSYRAMLAGLEELEKDLHQHIHKENNILFPRAVEKEQEQS